MKKMKYQDYYSNVANKISPYQWEEGIPSNALRFDTNTLPFPPSCLPEFFKKIKNDCPINDYNDPKYSKLKYLVADCEKVEPNMISITNSGDEAIDVLAKTFFNPGDNFLVTPPSYEMFTLQCLINNGNLIESPLLDKTYDVNYKDIIEKSRSKKIKIIFLCNPNNPTGTVIKINTIEEIINKSGSIVVVDEVYREFYGKSSVQLLKKYNNLVILRSFSKFGAIAGARVGYLISNPDLTLKFENIRLPLGVGYLSCKLAEYVLKYDKAGMRKQIEMIKLERKKLSEEFSKIGFTVLPSYANFLLVKIGKNAEKICGKLKQKGIIIRDRSKKKYLEGCVRITVKSNKENMFLIKAIKEVLNEEEKKII